MTIPLVLVVAVTGVGIAFNIGPLLALPFRAVAWMWRKVSRVSRRV